jgi:hypothetical protein
MEFLLLVRDWVCRWQPLGSYHALREDHWRRTFNFFHMGPYNTDSGNHYINNHARHQRQWQSPWLSTANADRWGFSTEMAIGSTVIKINRYESSRPPSGAYQCEGVPWTAAFYFSRPMWLLVRLFHGSRRLPHFFKSFLTNNSLSWIFFIDDVCEYVWMLECNRQNNEYSLFFLCNTMLVMGLFYNLWTER